MGDQESKKPTTYERLSARFKADEYKTRKQGGRDLTYITGEMALSRMNAELGWLNWSFRVVREGMTETEAWVLGELTVTVDGITITRQQYGNQDIMRGQHATADLFKSAATDALKKTATTIGVGLHLYDEDERREVEAEMREAKRTPRPAAPPTPIRDAAVLTGAAPLPEQAVSLQCGECKTLVPENGAVNIQKNAKGDRVDVSVVDFGPVCADRLGRFYCGPCYDKRYWKKEGVA